MPLGLKSQPLAHLLKSNFYLPAPNEPGDYPFGLHLEVGAQQSLSAELFLRIADQYPAQRYRGQTCAVPDGGGRDHLYGTLFLSVAVGYRDQCPLSVHSVSTRWQDLRRRAKG